MRSFIRNIKPITVRDILLLTGLSMSLSYVFLLFFGNITSGIILTFSTIFFSVYVYSIQRSLKVDLTLTQSLLSNIFNNSTDSLFLIDIRTRKIIDCNQSAIDAFETNDKEKLVGIHITDLCKDKDAVGKERIFEIIDDGKTWITETECITYGGKPFWGSFAAKKIGVNDDFLYLLRISNVTQLKETEASLKRQNIELKREKGKLIKANEDVKLLLREVHHRVKNNLQVITSMLRVQSSFIEEEDLQEIFQKSVNRINTISIIHENLYNSKDFGGLRSRHYFKELIRNLMHSYQYKTKVTSKVEIDEIQFGLDIMVPLGLLLNELVSNSLKHAFNNEDEGEIVIKITEGEYYTLIYSDNGIGLPEGYIIDEEETFGSIIITSLISQLGGKLEIIKMDKGMCYKIRFKEKGREEVIVKV